MNDFQQYRIEKINTQNEEFALVLYLDDYQTEFASELGTRPEKKRNLVETAKNIVSSQYPKLKVTMVKVVLGGMVITSFQLADHAPSASAQSINPNETTQQLEQASFYYHVSAGDTLWSLSQKFNTTVQVIKQANNLSSDALKLNQRLIIPKAIHTVKAGDYLSVLARDYGTTITAIKEANNLTSDNVRIGQTIVIPANINNISPTPGSTSQQHQLDNKSYTVVSGDSLSVIAKRFGVSIESLRTANNLSNDLIRVGQVLTIPEGSKNLKSENVTEVQPASPTTQSYTVLSGDTLYSIAKKHGVTTDTLREANNLSNDFLQVGQSLTIPGATLSDTKLNSDPVSEAPPTAPAFQSHRVVPGDTLYSIANKVGVTTDSLRSANNLSSDVIQLGQELTIPSGNPITNQDPATEKVPSSYIVKSGDTLWGISTKFGVSVDTLKNTNSLNSNILQPGQTLIIKSDNHSTPNPSPTVTDEERKTFTYRVVSGDNLSVIASRFGITVDDIRNANNLKTDALQVGQALTIVNGTNAPANAGYNSITYKTHIVASGDNIWDLSVRYGIPQTELLRANNLTTSSRLSIGQKLTIPVHNIGIKETVSINHGELLDWWTEAQYLFPIGKTAKVTDITTGKSFYIKRTVGANHADSETLTLNDTNIAKSIWGGFSWKTRAVLVEVDGRKLAASMSFMPHEREYVANNGITGHFDVYFSNSTRHVDGKADPLHQAQVERAAGLR